MGNAQGDNLMLKKKRSLGDLENSAEFVSRHVGPNSVDQAAMLKTLGCVTLEQVDPTGCPQSDRYDWRFGY